MALVKEERRRSMSGSSTVRLKGEKEGKKGTELTHHSFLPSRPPGIALVVGLQVGSGIFSSPGVVLASVGSSGAALVVWVLSGFLAWSGAASFAELGSAIPLNGGAQAYLACEYQIRHHGPHQLTTWLSSPDSYGPLVSYLFSWTAFVHSLSSCLSSLR